jgi:hypothetical protein
MRKDIKEWIAACGQCQVHGRNDLVRHEEMHLPEPVLKPFSRWHIDFVGILP